MIPKVIVKIIIFGVLLLAAGRGGAAHAQGAGTNGASTPASRADEAYHRLRARYYAEPTNLEVAWQFASACFDEGELAQNDTDRARVANEGIAVCRKALATDATLAPAHYYLGMNLGELARTETLGALGLLAEMEKEWTTTVLSEEDFDYAGADRNLGVLYRDAPGWPVALGNRAKARLYLRRAVKLHPEYPENHISLIEAYLNWGDRAEGKLEASALEKTLERARKQFSGPVWESAWVDWNARWAKIQSKLNSADTVPTRRRN